MIVIGGGIGGLLSAALSEKVTLFEKTPVLGGRFRNIDVRGFKLTTGALHMIPHARGFLPRILRRANAGCRIIESEPAGTFLLEREYGASELFSSLSVSESISISKIFLEIKSKDPPACSIHEYLKEKKAGERMFSLLRSFCGWSLSLAPEEVSAKEFFLLARNVMKFGGPGIPEGGCSGIVDALEKVCKTKGHSIMNKGIREIIVEEERVCGVVDEDGNLHEDKLVVSDIGAKATSKLCKFPQDYKGKIDSLKPSSGIKISVATEESLIRHNGVLFTPSCERVCGLNQVTNADSTLAPKGWHLVMTHQPLLSDNVGREKEIGLSDIERLFGEKKYEVLAVQTFRGKLPVNRAASGCDLDQKTPIRGLYLVGDCAKMPGGMEVEGIAQGVGRLVDEYLV